MAVYDFGLTDEEFFELTPRQFHALALRHKERIERDELLMGIETAVLANHSTNQPKKAYTPFHFMPSKQGLKPAEKPKRFNRQSFAESIRMAMRMRPAGLVVFKKAEPEKCEPEKEG